MVLLDGGETYVDRNRVQLLACVTLLLGKRSGKVTCHFHEGVGRKRTWPLYEASYRVTVREARSGRKVSVLTVRGTESAAGSCLGFAIDHPRAIVPRSLTDEALGDALRPLVHGTA